MKKLSLAALLFLMIASFAFGAESVTTIIQGVVPELLTISTDMGGTSTIDVFNTSSATLGYINVFSNRTGNWSITVTSTNGGHMAGITAGNTDVYPYTLKFGSVEPIDLSTPYVLKMKGQTTKDGITYEIGIAFQNFWALSTPLSPDTYRDTITITIAAT